ncbi:MAG: DUF4254 domain-containing protein [Chitinophagaceae bacterium]|jgi:hypothetical protein
MKASLCNEIFALVLKDYHRSDHVDAPLINPYPSGSLEALLYHKCWIDTVQWHLEDLVRDPSIDPIEGLALKRRIDTSNQHRTDLVEFIDTWLLEHFKNTTPLYTATINTESPSWAVDRLSILALKIYHMQIEAEREDAESAHRSRCQEKLTVLLEQRKDLSLAIDQLLEDIDKGVKYMKVYRQMKMYNDSSLNPVLYQQQK